MGKITVGKILTNSKGLKYQIIGRCSNPEKLKIKFIESGYECEAWRSRVHTGNIKDKLSPSVYGVGIMDLDNGANHVLYSRWTEMINRCYNKNCVDYKTYGAKGVTVCKEWHTFSNYVKDIEQKENYDKLCEDPYVWCIDKDLLANESKQYCNECTIIIHRSDNVREQVGRYNSRKGVLQFTKEGHFVREYRSLQEAHKVTGINKGNIGSCCRNERYSTAGGYVWKYKTKGE